MIHYMKYMPYTCFQHGRPSVSIVIVFNAKQSGATVMYRLVEKVSKPPYRFCKVVSFWIFLLIRLGLGLELGLRLGVGFVT